MGCSHSDTKKHPGISEEYLRENDQKSEEILKKLEARIERSKSHRDGSGLNSSRSTGSQDGGSSSRPGSQRMNNQTKTSPRPISSSREESKFESAKNGSRTMPDNYPPKPTMSPRDNTSGSITNASIKKTEIVTTTTTSTTTTEINLTTATLPPLSSFMKSTLPVPPKCTGYLSKQGQIFRTWKRRYFIMEAGEIKYYEDDKCKGHESEDDPIGVPLYLKGYTVSQIEPNRLLVEIPDRKMTSAATRSRAVSSVEAGETGKARTLLLEQKDPTELRRWHLAIQEHIDYANSIIPQ